MREDGSWQKTLETEVVMDNLNPSWKEIKVPIQVICNNDKHRPILIKCQDWDKDGSPDLIGECQVTINEFLTVPNFRVELINQEKANKKKKYTNSGVLIVSKAEMEIKTPPTFLDYIKGGCQITLLVAIDFTGSNGDPSLPESLHYISKDGKRNQYQNAIQAIGSILVPYDSDNLFPVWGFGAQVKGHVNHCFALTFDESNPQVKGVEGIHKVYASSIKKVHLSGPTYFTQVIQTATAIASEPYSQQRQHYSILLILTDGEINDMEETVKAVQAASETPLSIVIVGVGKADFKNMEKLDGDDQKDSKVRDIVQFVPYRNFEHAGADLLAKETLAEIPKQFLSFMEKSNIKPNAR